MHAVRRAMSVAYIVFSSKYMVTAVHAMFLNACRPLTCALSRLHACTAQRTWLEAQCQTSTHSMTEPDLHKQWQSKGVQHDMLQTDNRSAVYNSVKQSWQLPHVLPRLPCGQFKPAVAFRHFSACSADANTTKACVRIDGIHSF